MIGQERLRLDISTHINNGDFDRFNIITGAKGSGKKMLVDEIGKWLNAQIIKAEDNSVDTVRQMVRRAYQLKGKYLIVFADADTMSDSARNALLKVVEEPPYATYFILTLEDENNTLPTIRSRARIYKMDDYTPEQIETYASDKADKHELSILKELCTTPGEVNIVREYGVKDFYEYVNRVVDMIADVQGANAFKIAEKLELKANDEGYNLQLFLKAFLTICMNRFPDSPFKYAAGVQISSKYLRESKIRGINKQMLVDAWILDIRKEWR